MNSEAHSPNSIPALLRELRNESATLLQQQVALAKAEISEKVIEQATNAVQVGIGAFVAYAGAIILLLGLADLVGMFLIRGGMEADMAAWLSRAAVGIIIALVGWILVVRAKKAISAEGITPEKTVQTLQENKDWAQDKLQHSS